MSRGARGLYARTRCRMPCVRAWRHTRQPGPCCCVHLKPGKAEVVRALMRDHTVSRHPRVTGLSAGSSGLLWAAPTARTMPLVRTANRKVSNTPRCSLGCRLCDACLGTVGGADAAHKVDSHSLVCGVKRMGVLASSGLGLHRHASLVPVVRRSVHMSIRHMCIRTTLIKPEPARNSGVQSGRGSNFTNHPTSLKASDGQAFRCMSRRSTAQRRTHCGRCFAVLHVLLTLGTRWLAPSPRLTICP